MSTECVIEMSMGSCGARSHMSFSPNALIDKSGGLRVLLLVARMSSTLFTQDAEP